MEILSPTTDKLALLGGNPVLPHAMEFPWPLTDEDTAGEISQLYRSGNWSWNGPWEQRSAELLAKIHTAKHGMLLANGTVTLEAALHALGVGRGDEVIVPGFTWIATAMAVCYVGATPVFVDVEPDTLCLDPELIEEAITSQTKAIIPVHLYGGMADMERIMALARRHGLKVIEDCAHAHGGLWNGRGLGSMGDAGSFSFQQSKVVAAGEGGALITNDDEIAERLFRFKHIGYDLNARQGAASDKPPKGLVCHNYRATEFQGIVIHKQLEDIVALTERRNKAADILTEKLEAIPGLKVQSRGRLATPGRQSYYNLIVTYDPALWGGISVSQLRDAIAAEGCTRIGFTYGSVYRHVLWNIPSESYRIHGGWSDSKGEGCRISEEICTQRSLGFNHVLLDLPEDLLSAYAEAFEKVHCHASSLQKA